MSWVSTDSVRGDEFRGKESVLIEPMSENPGMGLSDEFQRLVDDRELNQMEKMMRRVEHSGRTVITGG